MLLERHGAARRAGGNRCEQHDAEWWQNVAEDEQITINSHLILTALLQPVEGGGTRAVDMGLELVTTEDEIFFADLVRVEMREPLVRVTGDSDLSGHCIWRGSEETLSEIVKDACAGDEGSHRSEGAIRSAEGPGRGAWRSRLTG